MKKQKAVSILFHAKYFLTSLQVFAHSLFNFIMFIPDTGTNYLLLSCFNRERAFELLAQLLSGLAYQEATVYIINLHRFVSKQSSAVPQLQNYRDELFVSNIDLKYITVENP